MFEAQQVAQHEKRSIHSTHTVGSRDSQELDSYTHGTHILNADHVSVQLALVTSISISF